MKLLLLSLLFMPATLWAQKKDTVLKYLDANLQFTTEKEGQYVGVAVRQADHWYFYAIYPDSTPLMEIYYKDKNLKVKDGRAIVYYPKYKKSEETYYLNNQLNGVYTTWYQNGVIKDSGLVKDNFMVDTWVSKYENGVLKAKVSFKNPLTESDKQTLSQSSKPETLTGIKDGPFMSWYSNGHTEAIGTLVNGVMEGEWRWFHPNGFASTIEQYKNGVLTDISCFDTLGKATNSYCNIVKPPLLKQFGDYKTYIQENLLWPEEAIKKKIQGTVKVTFRVTKKGTLENLKLEGQSDILKQAVANLFNTMKDWYPAVSHNRAIDSDEEMVIPFYRNN